MLMVFVSLGVMCRGVEMKTVNEREVGGGHRASGRLKGQIDVNLGASGETTSALA